MLKHFFTRFQKKLSPKRCCLIFNSVKLSGRRCNELFKKAGVTVGNGFTVTPPFYFEFGNISLGENVYINTGCVFLDNASISIGNNSLLGPQVRLCTPTHPISPKERLGENRTTSQPISIGNNVWIGAGAVILPGVTIGDNSVIAANSVVKSDIPCNELWAGCPAVFKRSIK
ncbi:sugar O-acetyltransferase [Serratia marcescens]